MSKNPIKSIEIMARIRVAQAALLQQRTTATLLAEVELAGYRRRSERELNHQLARLGAMLHDAMGEGHDGLQRLVAELVAASPSLDLVERDQSAGRPEQPRVGAAPAATAAQAEDAPAGEAGRAPIDPPTAATTTAATPTDPTRPIVALTADVLAKLNAALKAGPEAEPAPAAQLVVKDAEGVELPALDKNQRRNLAAIAAFVRAEPKNLRGRRPIEAEVTRLQSLFHETSAGWQDLGRSLNHALVTYFAAAARRVQAIADSELRTKKDQGTKGRIQALFAPLSRHSLATQPGPAHGLAMSHKPERGDWNLNVQAARRVLELRCPTEDWFVDETPALTDAEPQRKEPATSVDDAIRVFRKQVASGLDAAEFTNNLWLMKEEHALSERDPRVIGLTKAQLLKTPDTDVGASGLTVLAREVEVRDADDLEDPDPSDTPWKHQTRTRGLRAVIVGGDRRPEREEVIKTDLGVAELTWITTDQGMRHVQALESRINSGTVDLVLVLQRFIGHTATDKLFAIKNTSCRVVLVAGYGVVSIRRGLERHLLGITEANPDGALNK